MRSYVSRLHLASIVALAVLTVGFGLGGWLIAAGLQRFPAVPGNMLLLVGTAGWGSFTETLDAHLGQRGRVDAVRACPRGR